MARPYADFRRKIENPPHYIICYQPRALGGKRNIPCASQYLAPCRHHPRRLQLSIVSTIHPHDHPHGNTSGIGARGPAAFIIACAACGHTVPFTWTSSISGHRACTLIVVLLAASYQLPSCQLGPIHAHPGRQPCSQMCTRCTTLRVRLKFVVPAEYSDDIAGHNVIFEHHCDTTVHHFVSGVITPSSL